MSDHDSFFEVLSILTSQVRDLESRIAHQEAVNHDHSARLTAQSMLIERLIRPANVPSLHPVWRGEREAA